MGFSQVGIGTTDPTAGYELDVNGGLLVQKNFKLDALKSKTTQDGTFKFLLKLLNSTPVGEVAKLNLDEVDVAPINIINYQFKNTSKDNVRAVNLQFDATKYVVGISNIRYVGQEIVKGQNSNSAYVYIGNFVARTYIDKNIWYLEIRNRAYDAASDNAITYYATLIIYDRRFFKQLSEITVDFGGANNATATGPPSGL